MSRDEIAEPLGRHLDLGEQGQSRGSPRRRPPGEHSQVLVAKLGETAGGNHGVPFATVRDDDTGVEPGDQPRNLAFDVPEWEVSREQGMTGAEGRDLAHVEEGDLPAVLEHRRDLGSGPGDCRHISHVSVGMVGRGDDAVKRNATFHDQGIPAITGRV